MNKLQPYKEVFWNDQVRAAVGRQVAKRTGCDPEDYDKHYLDLVTEKEQGVVKVWFKGELIVVYNEGQGAPWIPDEWKED